MMNHPVLGPPFPEPGWVPAPRNLMRRERILALTKAIPRGLLEVGPGAGPVLVEFANTGFGFEALESSAEACVLADRVARASDLRIDLHAAPNSEWRDRFDCLFAFNVLEHIEDDRAALALWGTWLNKGGVLALSVPAGMSLWTAGDEWSSHFRRYERDALRALVTEAGFDVECFQCYGFPLINITERVSAYAYRRSMHRGSEVESRRLSNDRSGIDRRPVARLCPIIDSWWARLGLRLITRLQALCFDRDWGSGYVLLAPNND